MSDISFTCEYWNFLRGKSVFEPVPEHHGLDAQSGDVLKRQCDIEFRAGGGKR